MSESSEREYKIGDVVRFKRNISFGPMIGEYGVVTEYPAGYSKSFFVELLEDGVGVYLVNSADVEMVEREMAENSNPVLPKSYVNIEMPEIKPPRDTSNGYESNKPFLTPNLRTVAAFAECVSRFPKTVLSVAGFNISTDELFNIIRCAEFHLKDGNHG